MPNAAIEPETPLASFAVPISALEEVAGARCNAFVCLFVWDAGGGHRWPRSLCCPSQRWKRCRARTCVHACSVWMSVEGMFVQGGVCIRMQLRSSPTRLSNP